MLKIICWLKNNFTVARLLKAADSYAAQVCDARKASFIFYSRANNYCLGFSVFI